MNTETDRYFCFLCEASGNSVSMYARLNSVSNAEAAQALMEYCNIYPMPLPPRSEASKEKDPKPISERHDVYFEMLGHLSLSAKHLDDLRGRGLSDERISQNKYRTLPQSEQSRRFLAGILADFHDLNGIPGFYTDKTGKWNIDGKSGLLIPVCDMNGYIQGMQVRLDDSDSVESGRRYRWLSSRYKDNGTRSGNWIHVTGNVSSKTTYLTEGPLKGDVASYLDGDALFVCVAGINSTDGLTGVIKSLGISEIALAFDMDRFTNKQVRDGYERIKKTVSRIFNTNMRSLKWNLDYKGIDDYYLARQKTAA